MSSDAPKRSVCGRGGGESEGGFDATAGGFLGVGVGVAFRPPNPVALLPPALPALPEARADTRSEGALASGRSIVERGERGREAFEEKRKEREK